MDTMAPVIEVSNLSRVFRRKIALDSVNLSVAPGGVHGLVGENGAGKTTLIKHLLGLYRAKSGTVRVFGADPVKEPESVLARIGYLSEDRDLPGWMRIEELMRYTRSFYPNWDPAYAEKLRAQFDLDPKAKVRTLSRGQLAKAGLLTALAHRPELLLLDEPSSGLDPVVRRNILSAIIRTVADEGRTVLFSSHLLDEVERVADRVTMIHRGRCVLDATLEEIRDSHQRVVVRLSNGRTELPTIPGLLASEGQGKERTVICNAPLDAIRAAMADGEAEIVDTATPSLEEIFVARVGTSPTGEEG